MSDYTYLSVIIGIVTEPNFSIDTFLVGNAQPILFDRAAVSKIRQENVYKIIKNLRDSNGIKWLRTRISYHKFPNLG